VILRLVILALLVAPSAHADPRAIDAAFAPRSTPG
jgi:hypothetical protein